ncbi:MAG: 3-methyl-2-oxobutanoate hydroxymethyltransferase, partial [SAR324 cluster bacterium]|nr:3-methyl-2-oxobutanoate hydroxymethyltransferase [SAR324 cluster bacterium]
EGGKRVGEAIGAITSAGIPVMGHIGMTPQSVHQFGGFKVQGRGTEGAIQAIIDDALAVESAGAFSVVLECVPMELAAEITERLSIPTIGIGAGPHCDGQVLVMHDLLGLNPGSKYKFVRRYAELGLATLEAVQHYATDVVEGKFPVESESFHAVSDVDKISRYHTGHDSISRAS